MKKKQIVLLLAVCAIGALTACSSSAGDAGKSSGSQTFRCLWWSSSTGATRYFSPNIY